MQWLVGWLRLAKQQPAVQLPKTAALLIRQRTHLSGMERMRWLNSLRALIVRPFAGWCAARRMSWSQNEFISPAGQQSRSRRG